MKNWFLEFYPYLGWAGSLTILVCSLIAASVYRGKEGERYSITRHFVSELGEAGVSRLAQVFNAGLIAGMLHPFSGLDHLLAMVAVKKYVVASAAARAASV